MAIGGALRAALKAGNFVKVASESRRRARALAELNARGGIRGTGIRENVSSEMLFDRGYAYGVVPPSRMEMAGLPLENNGLPFAYTPRNTPPSGRANYVNPETGARATFAPDVGLPRYGNPIEAPYEGVRVWNPRNDYFDATPPWMGRGRAPLPDVPLLDEYGYPGMFASAFDPYSVNVPRAFGGISDYNIPF